MQTIDIIKVLHLTNLPKEDQEGIRKDMMRLIQRRVALRLLKELGPKESKKFIDFMNDKDVSEVGTYLEKELPNYQDIIINETMIVLGRIKSYSRPPITVSFKNN